MITISPSYKKATISLEVTPDDLSWIATGPKTITGSSVNIDLSNQPLGYYTVVVTIKIQGLEFSRIFDDIIMVWPDEFTRDEATDIWDANKSFEYYAQYGKTFKGKRIWVEGNPTRFLAVGGQVATQEDPFLFQCAPEFLGSNSDKWGLRIDPGMRHAYFTGFKFKNSASQTIVIKGNDGANDTPSTDIHFANFELDGGGRSRGGLIYVETSAGNNNFKGVYVHDGIAENGADEIFYCGYNVKPHALVEDGNYFRLKTNKAGNEAIQVSRHKNARVHSCVFWNSGLANTYGQKTAINIGSDSEGLIEVFRNKIIGSPEGIQMHSGSLGNATYSFYSNYLELDKDASSIAFLKYYKNNTNKDFRFRFAGNTIVGDGVDFWIHNENSNPITFHGIGNYLVNEKKEEINGQGSRKAFLRNSFELQERDWDADGAERYDLDGWLRSTKNVGCYDAPVVPTKSEWQQGYDQGKLDGISEGFQTGKDYMKQKINEL